MGLLTQRKEHRIPDLSRYDCYYQQRNEYDKSRQLSASAAYAASRSRESTVPVQQRSYSLTQPLQNRKVVRTRRRANSKGPYEVREIPRVPHNRVRLQESSGRSKSITRKTIRRIDGVDYVETITTTPLGDEDNVHYFNEFSDPVDVYVESERPVRRIRRIRKVTPSSPRSIRSQRTSMSPQGSTRSRQGDEYQQYEDGRITGLNYCTSEPVEETVSPVVRRATKSRPVRSRSTRSARKVCSSQTSPADVQGGRKRMTEQEMYAKALEIAQRNVYKNSDFPPEVLNGTGNQQEEQEQGYSRMGQRSFRNGSGRGKRRFNLFHKDKSVRAPPPPLPSVDVPRASRASHASYVSSLNNRLEQSIDRSSGRSTSMTSRRNLSDEEMYAQALAISKSKARRSSEELEAATQPLDLGGIERSVRSPHSNAPSFFTPAQTINENSEEKLEDVDSEWKDARSRVETGGNYNYSAENGNHYDLEESKPQQEQRSRNTPETESEGAAEEASRHGAGVVVGNGIGSEFKTESCSVEPQSEPESEFVPQSEPESELVPQSIPESELVSQSVPDSESQQSGPGSKCEVASELPAGFQRESEPGSELEPEPEAEAKSEAETELEDGLEAESKIEPEVRLENGSEPKSGSEVKSEFESTKKIRKRDAEAALEYHPEEISEAYEVGVQEMRRSRLSFSKNGDLVPTIRNSAVYSRPSVSRHEDAVPSVRNSVTYSRKSRIIPDEDLPPPKNRAGSDLSHDEDVNSPEGNLIRSSLALSKNRSHDHIAYPEKGAAEDLRASTASPPVGSPLHLGRKQREQPIDNLGAHVADVEQLGISGVDGSPGAFVDGSPEAPTTSGRKYRGFGLSRFKTKKRYSANNRVDDELAPDLPKASSLQPGLQDSQVGHASLPAYTQTPPQKYDEVEIDNHPKGKFRSIFNKMVEFGAENSGYQPSHEEKERQKATELEASSWRLNDNAVPVGLAKRTSPDAVMTPSSFAGTAVPGAASATMVDPRMGPTGTSGGTGRRIGGSTHPWRHNLQALRSNAGDANLEGAPPARNFSNLPGASPASEKDNASSNYEGYADEAYKDGYIDGLRDSQCERGQETAKNIDGFGTAYGAHGNAIADMGMEDKFRYARNSSPGEKAITKAEDEAQNRSKEQKGGLFKKLFKK